MADAPAAPIPRALVRPTRWTLAFGLASLLALVAWLTLAALTPGYPSDMETRKIWSIWVVERGLASAYQIPIDYPPGSVYLFTAAGRVYRVLIDPELDRQRALQSPLLTWLVKVPSVLFHLATAGAVFALVRRSSGERPAFLAATLLLFDPAVAFNIGHRGEYDSVHAFFSLLSVAAAGAARPGSAGALFGLAMLSKPQSWVLTPLVAAVIWRRRGWPGLVRGALGGTVALLVVLAPFIWRGRWQDLARLPVYMGMMAPDSQVLSANAHNLWWLPTLARGSWFIDEQPLVGGLAYRWVAVALVGLVVLGCLARLWRPGRSVDPLLLAAALGAGWFFFTPRAHENHAFFVLPFLAAAWPRRPRLLRLYLLASLAILANLALEDPLLVGGLALALARGDPAPAWWVGLTVVNVGLFGALVALLGRAVWSGSTSPSSA